jgi:hypothetical protein
MVQLIHKERGSTMKRALIAAMALMLCGISLPLCAEEVHADDISDGKTILIGRLGKPVGAVSVLEGQLISEPKAANGHVTAAIRVSKVDGRDLEKAQSIGLEFRPSQGMPPLHANQFVKLSGYEGAAFVGTPDAARADMGNDASPLDWKFASIFHVAKIF